MWRRLTAAIRVSCSREVRQFQQEVKPREDPWKSVNSIHGAFRGAPYIEPMRRNALAFVAAASVALAFAGQAAYADGDRVRGCMPPGQAHDILIQQKFIAPFKALGEAVRASQAEAVGVQLCRLGDTYVYDIILLQHDGRVSHTLVNARTGVLVAPVRASK